MKQREGLPFVKFMMLLGSMAPLFFLVGIRGLKKELISEIYFYIIIASLIIIPYFILKVRIGMSVKRRDIYQLNTERTTQNKDYLFVYFFTVLLPLYSVSINDAREFSAMIFAICFIIFVLWNLNLHFINFFFAFSGYRVFTIDSNSSAILLTTRNRIPESLKEIKAHRISNSVFIEFKSFDYANW